MGYEYFASLETDLDLRLGIPLFTAVEDHFDLVTLSKSSTELRLQTPENAASDWEAVRLAIAPRQIY
ncbi:hypothetical protein [Bremerella cremea]|uniref:hypothetical protein n=1 Tax=Bremerella cremea TaxID=1031537 RepID=UPI0031EA8C2E